jgi:hypothetical protein
MNIPTIRKKKVELPIQNRTGIFLNISALISISSLTYGLIVYFFGFFLSFDTIGLYKIAMIL